MFKSKKVGSMFMAVVMALSICISVSADNTSMSEKTNKAEILTLLNDELSEENSARVINVEYSKDDSGSEYFTIEYELVPQNPIMRAIGTGYAHFERQSEKNTWTGQLTVTLPEVISKVDYQLDWKDGTTIQTGGGTGGGSNTFTSSTRIHTYQYVGVYKPTFAAQVYGVSGPYGTIAVPSFNAIIVLFDL